MSVIDLTDVVGAPKEVRLTADGQVYKLPPQLPVELQLKLIQIGSGDADVQAFEDLHFELLELFRCHQPDLDRLPEGISQDTVVVLVTRVYGGETPDPPKPAGRAAGTRSTNPRRKSGSSTSSPA